MCMFTHVYTYESLYADSTGFSIELVSLKFNPPPFFCVAIMWLGLGEIQKLKSTKIITRYIVGVSNKLASDLLLI